MEDAEVPTESLQEDIHHHAAHAKERWVSSVALSAAILAVFAAISALYSGHHANEAMIDQIRASDSWAFYQAKGIKAGVLKTKLEMLATSGRKPDEKDLNKIDGYREEQDAIAREAKGHETDANHHLETHTVLARAVTLFQIAIAVSAVAALVKLRRYWYVGLLFGAAGLVFLVQGLLMSLS